jgi:aconitase A
MSFELLIHCSNRRSSGLMHQRSSFRLPSTASRRPVPKKSSPSPRLAKAAKRRSSQTTRIDTPNEVDYFVHGGILLYMLRQLAKPS